MSNIYGVRREKINDSVSLMKERLRFLRDFLPELYDARKLADAAGDREGWAAVKRLWLEYFVGRLGRMTTPQLSDYLKSIQPWMAHGEWTVFKTIDEPCVAFTAHMSADQELILICLGICYRFPEGSSVVWWNKIILPRLKSIE